MEMPYRIVAFLIFAINLLVRIYFQKQQAGVVTKKELYAARERFLHWLAWSPAIPILLYVFTTLLDTFQFEVSAPIRWFGAAIALVGTLLFAWSHYALGKNWSSRLEIREEHRLVTEGPYAFIRHPMYAALLFISIGLGLLAANWMVAIPFPLSVLLLYLIRVPSEEAMMLEHFGEAYREYCQRTGRLLPF